jgi:hypothetical protein
MPRYSNFSATTPKKTSKLINENAHILSLYNNSSNPYKAIQNSSTKRCKKQPNPSNNQN